MARRAEQDQYRWLPREHHYLGFRKLCGRQLRQVAVLGERWLVLVPGAVGLPNLASRVPGVSLRQLPGQWQRTHGQPLLLASGW